MTVPQAKSILVPRMIGLAQMRRLDVRDPVLVLTGNNDAKAGAVAPAGGIFA